MVKQPTNPLLKLFPIIVAALAGIAPLTAGSVAHADEIEITAFGEYRTSSGHPIDAPDTAKRTVKEILTVKLLRKTDCIVARLGAKMGIQVRHTRGRSAPLPVDVEVRHPPITGPDGQARSVDSWKWEIVTEPAFTGWHFEEPYELVPGTYTIAILSNGRVAAQKQFTVILPNQGDCGVGA